MNGLTRTGGVDIGPNPGASWHVKDVVDFNHDGSPDILWQNDNGQAAIWEMNGTTQIPGGSQRGGLNPGSPWHVEGTGDFNNDGRADILWQNTDGTPAIWLMNGLNLIGAAVVGASNPGPSWHVEDTGDFNGDGQSDILWQHDSGLPAIWTMDGTNITDTAVLPNPGHDWHII